MCLQYCPLLQPNVEVLEKKVEELCKQYQDAKLKAKGGSENNTPSHSGSPSSPGQKMSGGTHNAWGGFIRLVEVLSFAMNNNNVSAVCA